jgi:hypothetical protein
VFLLSLATAWAAIDGTVINRSTDKAQAGVMVLLFKVGQAGPEMLANTTSDAGGRFSFAQAIEGGPHLIEANYGGVNYDLLVPPGTPTANLQVEVFESSKQPGQAHLTQHMVILEPGAQQLTVGETFVVTNDGKLTYHDPARGTLRLFVPAAAGDSLRVMVQAPQGMPVERVAEPAGEVGVYKLNFAMKPGETRVDVSYAMPFSAPGSFAGKLLAKGVPTRLVVPNGVSLSGDGLKPLGQEPTTQAAIYEVSEAAYQVSIQGSGSMRAAANEDASDEDGPSIQQILPRVYDRLAAILIPALLILALGFVLLYRRGEQRG